MTTTFETNFLDAITALVMIPIQIVAGLLCLLWQGLTALWPYRKHITLGAAVVGFTALCVAYPLLPLGLAITAAVGWATYPRRKAVRA